uniref:RING-type domain-containing protein n=1 Tax=Poecilia latipinna TaxID=48699 RepID=A0A3B3TR56_9TELE
MAERKNKMDSGKYSCSICLDLLKDPVTIPCGHSYCMNCIKDYWGAEDQRRNYSCPQCRTEFKPRPGLVKNFMLAELVEDLKKTGLQAAPVQHYFNHLQPHYDIHGLKKHKLIFCRTDQQCICYLCLMEEHKGHKTVPAKLHEKRAEKQKKLQESQQQIHQRIQDREKDVKLLQQEVEAINVSADKAVEDSEKIFTELIRLFNSLFPGSFIYSSDTIQLTALPS